MINLLMNLFPQNNLFPTIISQKNDTFSRMLSRISKTKLLSLSTPCARAAFFFLCACHQKKNLSLVHLLTTDIKIFCEVIFSCLAAIRLGPCRLLPHLRALLGVLRLMQPALLLCVRLHLLLCVYLCVCVCARAYMCMYMCMYVCICIYMYIYVCIHTRTHTHTYT